MKTRVLLLPERYPAHVIAAIGLLFALAYGSSLVLLNRPGKRIVLGDALHHYVQLRSAVFDGDLHFRNEYVRMYGLRGGEPGTEWVYEDTPTGHVRNLMPVGPALLWTPLFLGVVALTALANAAGAAYPVDGFGRLFQATAGFSGVAAAAAGVWLSYKACRIIVGARAAIWATVTVWLASSAVYYSVISPTYSHASSLLAVSAFWLVWLRMEDPRPLRRYVLLGALCGVAALMRWQDAILLAIPALDLLRAVIPGRGGSSIVPSGAEGIRSAPISLGAGTVRGLITLAAAAAAFSPQMLVWWTLYGRPLAIPQGQGFMQWSRPALLEVLFSDWHGLLTWTPVILLCLIGFVALWRRSQRAGLAAVVFFALSWYVNAAVADWWAGEAFGSRRFVSCFPIFALALAALFERWSPRLEVLALTSAAIVAHTFLLLVQYQAFMHGMRQAAPYPRGAYELWLARFVVPFDLARELLR